MPAEDQQRRRPTLERASIPLAVIGGGLVGSAARTAAGALAAKPAGAFPTTTLAVNLAGSLLLGWYLARRERAAGSRWGLRFWAIGGLGSFTTFSAFGVEVVQLVEAGRSAVGIGYVLASTAGGLIMAAAGEQIGRTTR
jgi:CrcB protein